MIVPKDHSMSKKYQLLRILLFLSLGVNVILFGLLLQPKAPEPEPVVIQIEKSWYRFIVGRGVITDPEEVAVVLDCIDRMEFFGDDLSLIPMGGGITIYIYQEGEVKGYTFDEGGKIRDHQDLSENNWYLSPHDITPFLEEHIQKTYPYPEFR